MTAAISLKPRSLAAIGLVSAVGAFGFLWPLFVAPGSALAQHARDAPFLFGLLLPLLLAVVLAEVSEGGIDAKAIAMLGVLSALDAAIRPLGAGTAGIEVMFFLLILAGRVFGAGFGFVLGATSMFASALLTAGVGPWLPFQMLGAGWVGLGAALLPRCRGWLELTLLSAYGVVSSLFYGWALNMWFWPFATGGDTSISFVAGAPLADNLTRFVAFNLATSFGWDMGRAITTVTLTLLTGVPVLAALRRAARKANFRPSITFETGTDRGTAVPSDR